MAPTTHFWQPDFSRKGQYSAMFLICKRGSVVSRPLMVNQVNMLADSKRFIDWFSCCVKRYRAVVLRSKILFHWKNCCSWSNRDILKPREFKEGKRHNGFCWGPSLDLLRDSRNGALWPEHCYLHPWSIETWKKPEIWFQRDVSLDCDTH